MRLTVRNQDAKVKGKPVASYTTLLEISMLLTGNGIASI